MKSAVSIPSFAALLCAWVGCASAPDASGSRGGGDSVRSGSTTALNREPVPMADFTISSEYCGFTIDVHVVTNDEYLVTTTPANGTTVQEIRGNLVLRFTNASTGASVVRNVSGPSTWTTHSDGTGSLVGEGLNWLAFDASGRAKTGEPGLAFTRGHGEEQFTGGNIVTDFRLDGAQEDGCALLSR